MHIKKILFSFQLFIALMLWMTNLSAQVSLNATEHDFGDIVKGSQTYVDFEVTNTGSRTDYVLSANHTRQISYLISNKEIKPGHSITLRVNYVPKQKGAFKEEFEIYFGSSTKPVLITLQGKVKYIDPMKTHQCPAFQEKNVLEEISFEFSTKVIDRITKRPIDNVRVLMLKNGKPQYQLITKKDGYAEKVVKLGNYYFVVNAKNYFPAEEVHYVNRNNNSLLFELERSKIIAEEKPKKPDPIIEKEELNEKVTQVMEEPASDPIDQLEFLPNNVVFLIDVSASMKKEGKLDLLKASMIELLRILRPIDNISILTYASETKVILPAQPVMEVNKAKIERMIQSLTAGGKTEGNTGIKKSYQIARENFIKGGNNQIIIATDGAFSRDAEGSFSAVERNAKKGVGISVVGVKNKAWTEESMQAIAKKGGGHYIHIDTYEKAKKILVQEIKENSKK